MELDEMFFEVYGIDENRLNDVLRIPEQEQTWYEAKIVRVAGAVTELLSSKSEVARTKDGETAAYRYHSERTIIDAGRSVKAKFILDRIVSREENYWHGIPASSVDPHEDFKDPVSIIDFVQKQYELLLDIADGDDSPGQEDFAA
jgi:hypothetical protein